jgi:hypothetical protein
MNDRDLDLALAAMGASHTRVRVPPALRDRVRAVPEHAPRQRRWLPRLPRWRSQSMFSATKFVVAGVILALFGGFLLRGVMTQPSEEQLPVVGASASAPAEPTHPVPTSLEPSAEPSGSEETTPLVWERVEIPAGMGYESLHHSTGTYLVASSSDRTLVSRDGLSWSEVPVTGEIVASYAGTLVVATATGFSTVQVAGDTSAPEGLLTLDGLALPPGASRLNSKFAYGPAGLLFAGCKNRACPTHRDVWHTADGRSWERAAKLPNGGFEDPIATADGFVARNGLGGTWAEMYSGDGRTWERVNKPIDDFYELVGSAPSGTLLLHEGIPREPANALAVVTRHGLEPLSVPAKVKARWARSEPDGWGAGGLGLVGIFDGLVALSTDGTTWHLGTLPDSVPHLRFGDNGDGRPLLHVTEDMVLLETTTCLEPDPLEGSPIPPYARDRSDRAEVDCPGLHGSGQKTVWFRGTPR